MRIALVGGIYGKDHAFRRSVQITPETVLEHGLAARGNKVTTFDHYSSVGATQFDVIHVHHLSYGAIRAALDNGHAAFVYTSHDPLAMAGKLNGYKQYAARFVISRADAVIALSRAEADFQRRNYPLNGTLHAVIPNGIDAANYAYARNNSAAKGRGWQVLYVGQLNELKNVHVLLHALVKIKQPVELQLVYQNSALECSLRNLASELGLRERIHFLGSKNPQELAATYQGADVFVLPSAGEALPSVVTEAMLCGTPVIATDVGGVREQLGGFGVIVSPGNPNELAAAISHVFNHYEQFTGESERASLYARERFSIKSMVDRHLELYANLLGQRGPRRRHKAMRAPVNAALKLGVKVICTTK